MAQPSLRVIHSEPAAGPRNMAIDEALLHSASERGEVCLRFYQWRPATLSLGYFQRAAERRLHPASAACAMVRRASGGGAIVHDQELTYSLTVAGEHPWAADSQGLYRRVHQILIDVLQTQGIGVEFCGVDARTAPGAAPFLCFQRRTSGDLVVGGEKVAGSAQRRRRGAVLQHGSILLAMSRWAPELPGIRDISGVDLTAKGLARLMVSRFAQSFGLVARVDQLTSLEQADAQWFESQRYSHEHWTVLR